MREARPTWNSCSAVRPLFGCSRPGIAAGRHSNSETCAAGCGLCETRDWGGVRSSLAHRQTCLSTVTPTTKPRTKKESNEGQTTSILPPTAAKQRLSRHHGGCQGVVPARSSACTWCAGSRHRLTIARRRGVAPARRIAQPEERPWLPHLAQARSRLPVAGCARSAGLATLLVNP